MLQTYHYFCIFYMHPYFHYLTLCMTPHLTPDCLSYTLPSHLHCHSHYHSHFIAHFNYFLFNLHPFHFKIKTPKLHELSPLKHWSHFDCPILELAFVFLLSNQFMTPWSLLFEYFYGCLRLACLLAHFWYFYYVFIMKL